MTESVSFIAVFDALSCDPKLSEYLRLPMVAAELPYLPEHLGKHRLDEEVTLKRLMMVQANLFEAVLANDFGDDLFARSVRKYLESKVEELWCKVICLGDVIDQKEKYDLGFKLGLDFAVEQKYHFGNLTIGELLLMQPGVLVPLLAADSPLHQLEMSLQWNYPVPAKRAMNSTAN